MQLKIIFYSVVGGVVLLQVQVVEQLFTVVADIV
jgi:hypothetical protein